MSLQVQHSWESSQWDWPLQQNDGIVKVINTADKFEVGLDAAYFTPKELEVKVDGNNLHIHGAHALRTDPHGEVRREVNRTYHLPSDVDVSSLKSHLSKAGILTITANKK
ncbi:hypothetical protein FO519_002668 [Halicephalobus sp. NKZ332]|nr:hypothetical protein FO519_002668 [Halicephalobus sp. NKZ332]